ncbi:MAG: nascent polypeptide-associated complex protein [archaeon]|nr:nascent polypeptide-associated complex protein [archaeon]
MFGNIDPKKIGSMMKQMGIKQEEIEADRVIIEKSDGRLIIENPHVQKITMQGQESFQITGDITEESEKQENEEEKLEADIQTIVEQTGVNKEIAAIELEKNNGDIAETIISLSNQKNSKKK